MNPIPPRGFSIREMSEVRKVIPDKWVQNGYTLAHTDLPLFVHGGLPGESVSVEIVKKTADHSFGIVTEVMSPGDDRIEADCQAFPDCGGCSFRHISYDLELSLKRTLLKELKYLEICLDQSPAVIIHAERNGYRNHIQIHFDRNAAGFFRLHSNTIIPIPRSGCRNLSDKMNQAIREFLPQGGGTYRFREIAGKIYSPDELSRIKSIGENIQHDSHGDFFWEFPPDGFFQQNRFLLKQWLNVLSGFITDEKPHTVELFAGSGLVGGYAREKLGNYAGYEYDEHTVSFARKNFRRMNLQGNFESMDLYRSVPDLSKAGLIIANPPRAGLKSKIVDSLETWKGNLIYSSCNPHTMNRDIKHLLDLGFSCKQSAIFDFFPGTPHLEVAMSFVR